LKAPTHYVHKWDWDVLIVLDACRYDYYEKLTPFKGKLLKLEVESSDTQTWLTMNFPFWYPYVYVSANPYCNSSVRVGDFLGSEHFKKVIDVWKFGWSERLKTVPPWEVTIASRPYLKDEKVIIHYMQPHFPSIGKIRLTFEAWKPNPLDTVIDKATYPEKYPPLHIIKEAYEQNLRIVLEEIRVNLLHKIPKNRKVVITTDHGELLGEDGMLFHPCIDHPILKTVFWHELERP
jgi:hypothetical protein